MISQTPSSPGCRDGVLKSAAGSLVSNNGNMNETLIPIKIGFEIDQNVSAAAFWLLHFVKRAHSVLILNKLSYLIRSYYNILESLFLNKFSQRQ